jgi:hypothetical protein
MNTSTLSADTIIATGKSMTKKANAISAGEESGKEALKQSESAVSKVKSRFK